MGVYVRYMKMPESCLKCPMQFGGWCYVSPQEIDERVAPTVDEAAEQGKPEWCPLVEVPEPHGDLIDRNEVRNDVFHHLSIKGEENLLPAEKSIFGNIIKAKAVIEAEGE